MKQKTLYVVDYLLHEYNSVRDILSCILERGAQAGHEQILAHTLCNPCYPITARQTEGYKTYSDRKTLKRLGFFARLAFLWRGFRFWLTRRACKSDALCAKATRHCVERALDAEKPSLVVFFSLPPKKELADLCIERGIPYAVILYDTYIGDPAVDKAKSKALELYIMERSSGYFVPGFFFEEYQRQYACERLKPYDLPLLIDRTAVEKAIESPAAGGDFVYLGQIQKFRNRDRVQEICRQLDIRLDVYTTQRITDSDTLRIHEALTGEALLATVAGSRFCVAIDNSAPYQHYLPSKAYLYASFTGPIIVFGDNERSALKDFFADHPDFYYQDLNASTDGLRAFMDRPRQRGFNAELYQKYARYAPKEALAPLAEVLWPPRH